MKENDETNFSFEISASASDMVLHAVETGKSYLEFSATKSYDRVKVTFKRFISGKMLSVGGENVSGFQVFLKSGWLKELVKYQRKNHPELPNNYQDVKHFCFQGHDMRIEVLAEGFTWEMRL